ncbi:MAG: carboxypeptidase-like regulatory domain-containing protein, partial [Holophagales bacterium]|nr:carboxypeptidase-like regulatory domain-containing protein [Holophagales bacterium]
MNLDRLRASFTAWIVLAAVHGILAPLIAEGSSSRAAGEAVPIHGLVLDSRSEPVAGAEISIHSWALRRTERKPIFRSVTGPDGTFTSAELPIEIAYQVRAGHPGFVPATTIARPSAERIELVLEAGAVARGRLVDERGEPVAGVSVKLVHMASDREGRLRIDERGHSAPPTVSGSDGSFMLREVPPGRHVARFDASGYA